MKKFVFELEDILQFRKFEQEQAEIALAKALSDEREIQEKIEMLAAQKVTNRRLVENSKSIEAIYSANQFSQFVNIQTEHLLKQKAELALITEQKREALKKCIQNTDSLQSLKDSQFSEYKKNVRDAENKNIEDSISGRINT